MSHVPTECDLVLKGGITSGIAYPSVVLALKEKKYTFRNIGGTSVGAMAAAVIAAAEYNPKDEGYKYLYRNVEQWLGEGRNLYNLFQATPQMSPLMDILTAILSANTPVKSRQKKLVEVDACKQGQTHSGAAMKKQQTTANKAQRMHLSYLFSVIFRLLCIWMGHYPLLSLQVVIFALLGFILASIIPLVIFGLLCLIAPTVFATGFLTMKIIIVVVVFGIVGLWFGLHIGGIVVAFFNLPQHFYGICTGHSESSKKQNLTDWLCNAIDEMAGLPSHSSGPLTFGQLKNRENGKPIELKMITSNLSHGLPYVLPEGLHNFLFCEEEMRKFFPGYIVEQLKCPCNMKSYSQQKTIIPRSELPCLLGGKYYFFPDKDNIPVAVGARLSLSFPLLLAAVPLYTISAQAYKKYREWDSSGRANAFALNPNPKCGDIQKNWFSDGGISSNFPIQFFDAWLPGRPTFGVNLTKLGAATSALDIDETKNLISSATKATSERQRDALVYLPGAEERQDPEWQDIDGLLKFVFSIFGTAQNYRDTLQANLPSYRERTVQIRFSNTEGGLNLLMPPGTLAKVIYKGKLAGQALQKFKFNQHLWVRFLVLMSQLERNLGTPSRILCSCEGRRSPARRGTTTGIRRDPH